MKIAGFKLPDMIQKLCKPAQLYLLLSLIYSLYHPNKEYPHQDVSVQKIVAFENQNP